MSTDLQVVPLTRSPREVDRFLKVSYAIYRDDPLWVAPLLMDLKKVFEDRNPLFEHAEMQLWVATRQGREVGRIAGILDHHYNQVQKDNAVFFGFFESVNEPAVSHALFEAVCRWARQKNARRVLGPISPTTNDECGLLIQGFDSSPVFMMTYNLRYYADLVAAEGFQKSKDLLAFFFDVTNTPMDRFERLFAKFSKRHADIKLQPIRKRTLNADLQKIMEVYNEAWEANWGFVPMTAAEIHFMAQRLKPLLFEGLAWLALTPQETVGFLLATPDYNEALRPLKGRLFTPGLIRAAPYLLGWKATKIVRVITLGVKPNYRGRGIEAAMLCEGLRTGIKAGFKCVEASWILEDNTAVQRLIQLFGGQPYKTYRIYERNV